jgi:CubicO group peptidase (beta-lactamase class C family)
MERHLKRRTRVLAGFLVILATGQAVAKEPPELAGLRDLVERELKLWNMPGMSLAVVKDGRILLLEGYGLRDLERQLPMTPDTVQPIASVTKNIAVASLATLVRDGKLSWDRPVREYFSDFRMHTDYATGTLTIRDMITHRTGLPRHDYSWFRGSATREELYKRLQHLPLSAEPRARFQYNNLMYMTAGYIGGRIAGSTWEQLTQRSLFTPLKMNTAGFRVGDMAATPFAGKGYHFDHDEKPRAVEYLDAESIGPAGSINASARDMANYLLMLTDKGKFEGRTILNEADIIEMTNPQMVMPDARRFPELGPELYGMGFFLITYRGERLVRHGGNLPGVNSLLSFMPQHNIGIYLAINGSGSGMRDVITYAIYDRLLKLEPIDWSARLRELRDKNKASQDEARVRKISPRREGTRPAHPLDEYAGEYEHPGYGLLRIERIGERLQVAYNGLSAALEHFHYETFATPDDPLNEFGNQKVDFKTDLGGDVAAVAVTLEPAVDPVLFKRRADKRMRDPVYLRRFEGNYAVGANMAVIKLRADSVLTLSIVGQPTRELSGITGTRFAVKGLNGFTIEFMPRDGSAISEAAFYQPTGNFVAKKK